ncbi:MAG: hypothetical protein ACO26G_05250 [Rickettsiales bacterium]
MLNPERKMILSNRENYEHDLSLAQNELLFLHSEEFFYLINQSFERSARAIEFLLERSSNYTGENHFNQIQNCFKLFNKLCKNIDDYLTLKDQGTQTLKGSEISTSADDLELKGWVRKKRKTPSSSPQTGLSPNPTKKDFDTKINPLINKLDGHVKQTLNYLGISHRQISKFKTSTGVTNRAKIFKILGHIKEFRNISQGDISCGNSMLKAISNYESIDKVISFFDKNHSEILELRKNFGIYSDLLLLFSRSNNQEEIESKFSYIKANFEQIKKLTSGTPFVTNNILNFIAKSPLKLHETMDFVKASRDYFFTQEGDLDPDSAIKYWEILSLCSFKDQLAMIQQSEIIKSEIENIKKISTQHSRIIGFGFKPTNIAEIISSYTEEQSIVIIQSLASIIEDLQYPAIFKKLDEIDLKENFESFIKIIADNPKDNLQKFLKIIPFLNSSIFEDKPLRIFSKSNKFSHFYQSLEQNLPKLSLEEINQETVNQIFQPESATAQKPPSPPSSPMKFQGDIEFSYEILPPSPTIKPEGLDPYGQIEMIDWQSCDKQSALNSNDQNTTPETPALSPSPTSCRKPSLPTLSMS